MKRNYNPNVNPKWQPEDEIEFREGVVRRWKVAARRWEYPEWRYTLVGLPEDETQPAGVLPSLKQSDIETLIAHQSGVMFQGEMMTCAMCDKVQPSDPVVNSDWRIIEVDSQAYYFCTDHFPPDTAVTKNEFGLAYQLCLQRVAEIRQANHVRQSLAERRQNRRDRKAGHHD